MTFQKRLQRIMQRRNMRVADLARELETPYTTVREWALYGRRPTNRLYSTKFMMRKIAKLEG